MYPDAVFNYIGAEGTVKVSDIQEYIDDGSINYLGTTKDVRPYLEECTVYILPSYREGMPMSIIEAEATGRAIISTNSIGCRDTVVDGYNGFLIDCGNVKKLANQIVCCIERKEDIDEMCKNSRGLAEERFDQRIINQGIIDVINID